ncbi:uncharacterized protein LOC120351357 [Nilaparvata lugens]|uniref:uncharacterized protein LOC120351357 n=1 Tax=Nilaparvata lugens TaxID=108931 RepID=UPI00193D7EA5|nr:uncharacterized protein LOC120351357 [Nilaparvata lugens]
MSGTCGVCNVNLSSSKTSDVVACSGSCKKSFHLACIKDDSEETKVRSVKQWRCKDCRDFNSLISDSNANITKDFMRKVLEGFRNDFFRELKLVRDEMAGVVESIGFLSDKVDANNSLLDELRKDVTKLQNENKFLRAANASVNAANDVMQERIRALEHVCPASETTDRRPSSSISAVEPSGMSGSNVSRKIGMLPLPTE